MALLNLENIAVLAISKEVVQGIGHGSPQVIIRLVFAQIISKITGSEVMPFAVITDESTGVKYPLADYALLIRQVLRFNAAKVSVKMGTFSQYDHPHTLSRYAEAADCLKLDGNTDEEKLEKLINAITELMHKIGIHNTIREYGVSEEAFLGRLDEMAEQAFDDQCTGTNPRYPRMKEIKEMYLNAYYGG